MYFFKRFLFSVFFVLSVASCDDKKTENLKEEAYPLIDELCRLESECYEDDDHDACIESWTDLLDESEKDCLGPIVDMLDCIVGNSECINNYLEQKEPGKCDEVEEKGDKCF